MNNDRMPTALFLDLDDTIVDDSGNVETSWTQACSEAALDFDIVQPDRLVMTIFEVRDWYWSDADRHRIGRSDLRAASTWIVEEALRRLSISKRGLGSTIANRYRDIREEGICLLPGALEALATLRTRAVDLALLTNGSSASQREKLRRFGLEKFFDHICIEGEFGCGKPDERVYLGALKALGRDPHEVWMVGDNLDWDVGAPMRLGIAGIWLDRFSFGLPEQSPVQPHRIIQSLAELL